MMHAGLSHGVVQARGGVEYRGEHLAFIGLGAAQSPAQWQAVQGADQVQPQPPEVARMGSAVAVLGPAGQCRALLGLPGPAALDRSGSTTHTSSPAIEVWAANCPISQLIVPARLRSRLL